MISDVLVSHLRAGSIKSVAGLRSFIDARHAQLDDESELELDAVILCTGYKVESSIHLEFESASTAGEQRTTTEQARLYQRIFLTSHPDSVAYMFAVSLGLSPTASGDLVSMAIAQVWKGSHPLPSRKQMEMEV